MLCVSICVRRKARLRIAEQIQVYENAQTACGLRAFGLYGNSTARPVQTGDAPSFYGVVGALLRGSHRCVSLGALFRTHTCRVKEGIKAPFTTPSGQTLREDYSRQTGHLRIATLNARSFYISDGLQATTAATAMSNNANSLNRRYSGALVSNCAIGFISSRRSERRTQQRPEDAPCLANIASTLLCVCGYFTARAALYSIKLVHSQGKCISPFHNELKCPMAMATQPKGWPPT